MKRRSTYQAPRREISPELQAYLIIAGLFLGVVVCLVLAAVGL